MKKLILAISLFALQANAQDIYDKMADEVCQCVKSKKIDIDKAPENELKMQMGVCILQSYTAHASELKLDISDKSAIRKLGEDIGVKMVTKCPEIIVALGSRIIDEDDARKPQAQEESDASITGTLMDIKTEQFVTFNVKDSKSRTFTFILLDYFDTAALFTDNQLKKNDKVTVSYSEVELYDPKVKEFRYYKVITGLQKN